MSASAIDPPLASGYTLPVWVTAAACAALAALRGEEFQPQPSLELLEPPGRRPIPVHAAAGLADGWALGETVCDPGQGLDLTRGLPVWVLVRWLPDALPSAEAPEPTWLQLEAGEGVGIHAASGEACLSDYARRLLEVNLRPRVPPPRRLLVRVVLPGGRRLAERTSNAAFGVVEGLALIGTQAATQPGAAPDQLQRSLDALAARAADPAFAGDLALLIGENGLDLAQRLGLPPALLLKSGNWLGPLLVAAAAAGVRRLLLFGYQGKLLKLAGGIFHTHHHLADGRAEVLTSLAALDGLAGEPLVRLHDAPTVEAALAGLEEFDPARAVRLRQCIAAEVERRSVAYLARHGQQGVAVGAVLFDRARRICARGPVGGGLLRAFGATEGGP